MMHLNSFKHVYLAHTMKAGLKGGHEMLGTLHRTGSQDSICAKMAFMLKKLRQSFLSMFIHSFE